MFVSLRPPSSADLARLVASQTTLAFTYRDVGATRDVLPPGYHHDRWTAPLESFDRGASALANWAPQRGADIRIFPAEPVTPNHTFALVIRLPGTGYITAAGRVVYVIDEPACFGFAYGTLPAHPEEGEEAFFVRQSDGGVEFEITAFSRARHPLARAGAPFTRWMQLRVTRRYLAAMQQAASLS